MTLQNRVTPFGEIVAIPERGTMMGNRGGRIHHNDRRELQSRLWANKQWITCLLEFKGRHRAVVSPNHYTELFFLDEATALAAGHRPCADRRRGDFQAFRVGEPFSVDWCNRRANGARTHGACTRSRRCPPT